MPDKAGDRKTWPNGNIGEFDGHDWILVGTVEAPKGSELTRVDTNAVGVDHDKLGQSIVDFAVRHLPSSIAPTAAAIGSFHGDTIASALEMLSSPENIATMGAGGVKGPAPAVERLPRTSYPVNQPGAVMRAAGEKLSLSPMSGVTAKAAGEVLKLAPSTQTFQDLPLAQQMEHLPLGQRPNPMRGQGMPAPVNLSQLQKLNAQSPPAAPPSSISLSQLSSKPRLSAEDVVAVKQLIARGMSQDQALQRVAAMRQLGQGLPTNAEVNAAVGARNQAGTWKP